MKQKLSAILLVLAFTLPVFSQQLVSHPWQGKRVAYLGDSITDPRVKAGTEKWWTYLQQWLGIDPFVYAISGRQWNDIPHQAEKLLADHGHDFDAILIFMGTNDFNAAVPIGEWYVETEDSVVAAVHAPKATVLRRHRQPSFNKDTYRGRMNIALNCVKRMFPEKQIVLLTPIHRAYFYGNEKNVQPTEEWQNACGEWFSEYVESVKQAANIWAVPVIDLHAVSGLYPVMDEFVPYFHNGDRDRLHPNDKGYARIARTLVYQLAALPCTFD